MLSNQKSGFYVRLVMNQLTENVERIRIKMLTIARWKEHQKWSLSMLSDQKSGFYVRLVMNLLAEMFVFIRF
jgi:hypothetical protein